MSVATRSRRPPGSCLRAAPGDDDARIARAYLALYGLPASAEEREVGRDFLARAVATKGSLEGAWHAYAQVLLCANEFIYVD